MELTFWFYITWYGITHGGETVSRNILVALTRCILCRQHEVEPSSTIDIRAHTYSMSSTWYGLWYGVVIRIVVAQFWEADFEIRGNIHIHCFQHFNENKLTVWLILLVFFTVASKWFMIFKFYWKLPVYLHYWTIIVITF